MFYFSKIPLVRILLPFLVGIILARLFDFQLDLVLLIAFVSLLSLVLGLIVLFQKLTLSNYSYRWVFGLLTNVGLLVAGISYSIQYNDELKPAEFDSTKEVEWIGEVRASTNKLSGIASYQVEVLAIHEKGEWVKQSFPVLIYAKNSNLILQEGERVYASSYFNEIQKSLNPHQFDFKNFCANKGIYYSLFESDFTILSKHKSLVSFSAHLRKVLINCFVGMGIQGDELAVLTALTLGDKSQLSAELKTDYASAGAMHILAVSGLHVGIIYLLFMQLFKRFDKSWWQRLIKAVVLLFVVWAYAMLTGFSPSVQRASCMFSFIIISSALNRNSNTINSIAGSALLLVLINPKLLFELGFQLSYLAVIGIILIHPILKSVYSFKFWLFDKVWSLTIVSFAAQLFTLPLILYYFHQFPNWFLLVNLFVIPLAFIIVVGALFVLVIWALFQSDLFLAEILNWVLKLLNSSIKFSQELPYSTTEGIWLSDFSIFLMLGFVLAFVLFLFETKPKYLLLSLTLFIGILVIELYRDVTQMHKKFVGVYALNDFTLCFVNGLKAEVFSTNADLSYYDQKIINDHLNSIGIKEMNWFFVSDSIFQSNLFDFKLIRDNVIIAGLGYEFRILEKKSHPVFYKQEDCVYLLEEKNNSVLKYFTGNNQKLVYSANVYHYSFSNINTLHRNKTSYLSQIGYLQLDVSK